MIWIRTSLWVLIFVTGPVFAAPSGPQVAASLSDPNTSVGQPLTLTIEILVPTWMTTPPKFPDLEQPDLLVRHPSKAGSPISREIDGSTWSGVSRRYFLIPLKSGRFEVGAAEVGLTWADPDTQDPISDAVSIKPILFDATVPTAAENLNPIFLAENIQLEQIIEGESNLQLGDPITRTITAKITGTTPILLPLLLNGLTNQPQVRSYPGEAKTSENLERGVLSGTRIETATYLAQQSGVFTLPDIELQWFDLDEQVVKTARLDGASFDIAEAPPPPPDLTAVMIRVAGVIFVLAIFYGLLRRLSPLILAEYQRLLSQWHQSPRYARRQVLLAIKSKDLAQTYHAVELWNAMTPEKVTTKEISNMLIDLGKSRYSGKGDPDSDMCWKDVQNRFILHAQAVFRHRRTNRRNPLIKHLNP